MAVYFFWQGLVISIILSIVLSIGLTLFLNSSAKRRIAQEFEDEILEAIETDDKKEKKDTESKSGGFILIGPFPIIFGSGGARFDKKGFKWALLFFIVVILTFLLLGWTIRFI
ncbi:MAG: DUF131 domain-containing protein [Methanimicrococcus sp.]|nr:DUF131 domain-containing protein [Methanimicrococcus sp.]